MNASFRDGGYFGFSRLPIGGVHGSIASTCRPDAPRRALHPPARGPIHSPEPEPRVEPPMPKYAYDRLSAQDNSFLLNSFQRSTSFFHSARHGSRGQISFKHLTGEPFTSYNLNHHNIF